MTYTVTFVQYHTYEVDAEDENEAFDNAYDEFQSDMRCSIACTSYDYAKVECNEDEDED